MKTSHLLIPVFLLLCPLIHAQNIIGKWYSPMYQQEVHFHKEGVMSTVAGDETAYGCFQMNEDRLVIAFFNENTTKASYTFHFPSSQNLTLQKEDTGEFFYFTRTGEAEIPEEMLQKFRESIAGTGFQAPVQADEVMEKTINESHTSSSSTYRHAADLPGKLPPAGTRGSKGIVGTWQTTGTSPDPEVLALTADGYFVITTLPSMPDVFPATYGYGKYSYENNLLKLKFFNYFQMYDLETTIPVHHLSAQGFDKPYDFYGNTQYIHYTYQGPPTVPTGHRTILLAYLTFHRMLGQWKSHDTTLKFMGDGDMILELKDGQFYMSEHSVNFDGKTAQFKHIGADEYYYTGEILEFTPQKLVLQSTQSGEVETFFYEGKPQLNDDQLMVYAKLRQIKHQVAMDIIDAMDGTRDWIWVDQKY